MLGNKYFSLLAFCCAFFSIILLATPVTGNPAGAADLTRFNAGNIISDQNFYNGASLATSEIQQFLNNKVPTCTINNGDPSHASGAPWGSTVIANSCLKNYVQDTPSMGAQPGLCSAYQGGTAETAAQIIYKVGQACNISQKVLLVLIEKEQSLVTDTWPTVRQFSQASGFACYDNGQPCVTDYAGFFYQVWSAARQLQRYGSSPFTWYPVGQVSNVLYQANAPECGTKAVLIENRATAALYYYTPYTPNQAALNAGYGTGDACSAYGNRNFYQLYTDWFGSTTSADPWALAASSSFLGAAITAKDCGVSRCYQIFSGGAVYSGSSTGVHPIKKTMFEFWGRYGYETGTFGLPTSDPTPIGSSTTDYTQTFQNGTLEYTATNGIRVTAGADPWALAASSSFLGAAITAKDCGVSRCYQIFSGGAVYSGSSTGVHPIKKTMFEFWGRYGYETGTFGLPTSDPTPIGSSTTDYTQTFQNGTLEYTATNGIRVTAGADPWALAASSSFLGAAITAKDCGVSRCYQIFSGGAVYSGSSTGVHPIKKTMFEFWGRYGYETGTFGLPTSDPTPIGSSTTDYTQTFQNGTLEYTATNGIRVTAGADPWALAASSSFLGAAITAKDCGVSRCYQIFSGGAVYSGSSTGVHPIKKTMFEFWGRYGYETGTFGLPTSDPTPIGSSTTDYTQTFQNGTLEYTATNGIRVTAGADPWALAASSSFLGAAITAKDCGVSRCYQIFSGGAVYSGSSTGVHPIKKTMFEFWGRYGYETGTFGLPTSDPTPIGSSTTDYTQTFQNGTLEYTATNGIRVTAGADPWALAASSSFLGAAITAKDCGVSRCYQIFSGGAVYSGSSTGVHPIKKTMFEFWGRYGYETGTFGLPTSDPTPIGSSTTDYTQTFQNGTLEYTATNGIRVRT